MKIAILTLGSRGDVQPYAVLGKALMQSGHDVTISTAKNFEKFIRSYEIPFVPVNADFQQLLISEEGKKIRKNPFMAKKLLARFVYPMMQDAFLKFYRLAQENDKVLFHVKTMADSFADQFPDKMIKADVVPAAEPTSFFPNPVFAALPLPRMMNRLTFTLTELGLRMWKKPVADFRRQVGLSERFVKPALPSIYGISEHFLAKPGDYPKDSHFTGFWSERSTAPLEPELSAFLSAGDSPLLITFGSMPFETRMDMAELISSIRSNLKLRIILVRGWAIFDERKFAADRGVLIIDGAPFESLFPLVKAIVHHGGIGTIASCLRAGKPFLSCPVLYPLGDQYFWGRIAEHKGLAVRPLPLKAATVSTMLKAITRLVNDSQLQRNAQLISADLALEDGVGEAIRLIESKRHDH
jgi:sterol 3beta-glucosyltransferase